MSDKFRYSDSIPCPHCKGRGYFHIETAELTRSGDVKCEHCLGTGHIQNRDDIIKFLQDAKFLQNAKNEDVAAQLTSEVIKRAMKKVHSSRKKGKRV